MLTDVSEAKPPACDWSQSDWSCVSLHVSTSVSPAKRDFKSCYSRSYGYFVVCLNFDSCHLTIFTVSNAIGLCNFNCCVLYELKVW